ncbi:hypothetical protein EUTSA_v10015505mg, partial [Eutrema salsugineum]
MQNKTNEESSSSESDNNHYKLKSIVFALGKPPLNQSSKKNTKNCLITIEEKILGLELFIREKSYLFEIALNAFMLSEIPVKHTSEAEVKIYELQKQIFELRRELEMQHKRRLDAEIQAEIAEEKIPELSSKIENVRDLVSLGFGLHIQKLTAYLMTQWHQHLSGTLQKKWIPSIKDACVTFTIYLKPKIQYLIDKSIEVLYTSKQVLTPQSIQGLDVSYYYLE